jgi:hypothetical protein
MVLGWIIFGGPAGGPRDPRRDGQLAQAQKQDYVNQKAFQNANSQYASWQAGFNKRITNANAQYNYWQETVNYNQNLAYSRSLQNYELLKEIAQAEVVGQTRAAAGASFVSSSEAINQSDAARRR